MTEGDRQGEGPLRSSVGPGPGPGRDVLAGLLPLSLVLGVGSFQRSQKPALCWGRGDVGMDPWGPSHRVLNGTATPRANGGSKAQNADGVGGADSGPARTSGPVKGAAVCQEACAHSMPSDLLMQPDGRQLAPGLVAASQRWTWLSVRLLRG